jgi:hypothetical protein
VIGDPDKMLRHASKSARNPSEALKIQGTEANPETTGSMLKRLGYKTRGHRRLPLLSIINRRREEIERNNCRLRYRIRRAFRRTCSFSKKLFDHWKLLI